MPEPQCLTGCREGRSGGGSYAMARPIRPALAQTGRSSLLWMAFCVCQLAACSVFTPGKNFDGSNEANSDEEYLCLDGRPPPVSAESRGTFLQILLCNYDNKTPPNYDGDEPCEIDLKLYINSFDSVSETDMEFSANVIIEQRWTDKRLEFMNVIDVPYLELDTRLMDRVWVPDLYIVNERSASFHDVTVPNRLMHLYQNGSILYKARISLTASCYMDLRKYPMDEQTCSLYLQSFTYTTQNVVFRWSGFPITFNPQNKLPQFNVTRWEVDTCRPIVSEGNFSCLKVDFHLQRSIGFYVLHLYTPSCLIVLISWLSFWLNQEAVPARTSLGILTVLTITTQSSSSVANLPKVSYVKAIDVWMATCICFVFTAFLEYAVVNVLLRRRIKRYSLRGECPDIHSEDFAVTVNLASYGVKKTSCQRSHFTTEADGYGHALHLDKLARIVFPVAFSCFNLVYWIYYCL